MEKWNLKKEWKKVTLVIGVIFTILILDFINGSSLRFLGISGTLCLATRIFQVAILVLLVSLFIKKEIRSKIQKWSLIIIIPAILAILIENRIVDYQYEKTRKSLEEICLALEGYKAKEGKYPQNLEKLKPIFLEEIPNSGFGLFDSKIKYKLLQNGEVAKYYKVKFGFICEAGVCGGGINLSTSARCKIKITDNKQRLRSCFLRQHDGCHRPVGHNFKN